jgi:hypothetical protein
MRKDELIRQLQQIEGNPEIVLWNGHVGDYMHIGKLADGDLVKTTVAHYLEMCQVQDQVDRQDWSYKMPADEAEQLKKRHRKFPWEINSFVSLEDIQAGRYKKKRVVYIEPKKRGETHYDRLGSVEY